jgi:hypothetical protein
VKTPTSEKTDTEKTDTEKTDTEKTDIEKTDKKIATNGRLILGWVR